MTKARKPLIPDTDSYNRRGFWALVATQMQGAFNDNVFRYLIIFFLLDAMRTSLGAGDGEKVFGIFAVEDYVPALAQVIFCLPFLIFPAIFGAIADRFSKQRVALATKYLEVVVMVLGGLAFYLEHSTLLWAILFLMATQSAMFGPAKYGILPEILPDSRLSFGNGVIQMTTMVAIIAGMGIAGPLYKGLEGSVYLTAIFLVAFSSAGVLSGHFITKAPAANPDHVVPRSPLKQWQGMGQYFRAIWVDRTLFNVVLGYIYFWFAGSLAQSIILKFSVVTLGLSEDYTSYLLAAIAIGIALGALAAGFLSRGKIEMGLIPIGAAGMAVFALLVAVPEDFYQRYLVPELFKMAQPMLDNADGAAAQVVATTGGYYFLAMFLLFGLGFFAGFFDVPLAATIQHRAPKRIRGGIIATTNMLTWVGIGFAGVVFLALGWAGFTPHHLFMLMGAFSLGMGLYISLRLPILLLRMLLWFADGTLVKLHVTGRKKLPAEGGGLLVGTHLSFVDAVALLASIDRDVYFVMREDVYAKGWIARFARMMNAITVPVGASEEALNDVAWKIREAVAAGHLVCIQQEAFMEADGPRVPWHHDYGMLVEGTGAPIVPVFMTRLWESLYVFEAGRIEWRWPGQFRYPIHVRIGDPLPADAASTEVEEALCELDVDHYLSRPYRHTLLHRAFIKAARRYRGRLAIADATTGPLSYFKALVGGIVFARKLRVLLGDEEKVGVLVPPTVGGALTNIALQMLGKVPVNLNYSAPEETMLSCAERCGIKHTITAHKVLERLPIKVPGEPIYLEDIRESVTKGDRMKGLALALLAPIWWIEKALGTAKRTEDDLATIIFSSGSEGEPKGAMLTQRNIMSQVETVGMAFPHGKGSCVLGFLPFFHSFGFTGTLWMPLLNGVSAVYHPNPLEPRLIGGLVQKYKATILIGTATFLQGFIRRCTPEQLETLTFVVSGAEKLPERVRLAFKEKFGVEPFEGFGTTELSPVVSVNLADKQTPGFFAKCLRHGTIGQPLPGQSARIVDPDTGDPLPIGTAGLLLMRGPNVMLGYLDDPERTQKVLNDGWYTTGDIAALDEDGFITITDRLARFSKIAGEMVPHTRVEETLHGLIETTEQVLAVASVPDTAKGERLVVLHTMDDAQLETLINRIPDSGLPNLWRPRASAFYRIDEIPVLGTGKMDIKSVKRMALALDLGE